MTKKITSYQLGILLFIISAFKIFTSNPYKHANFSEIIIGILLSISLQFFLILPLIFFYKKHKSMSVIRVFKEKNLVLGNVISCFYMLFYVISTLRLIMRFSDFMSKLFPELGSKIAIILVLTFCGGYIAFLGIESIARTSGIILVFLVLIMIFLGISCVNFIKIDNIEFLKNDVTPKNFFSFFIIETAKASEIAVIIVLIPHIKSNFSKSIPVFLSAKVIFSMFFLFLSALVLGGYAKELDFAYFALSELSHSSFIERYDGIYLILWTLTAVISVSFFINALAECVKTMNARNIEKGNNIIFLIITAIIAITALLLSYFPEYIQGFRNDFIFAIYLIILAVVLPVFANFIKVKGGKI